MAILEERSVVQQTIRGQEEGLTNNKCCWKKK